MKLILSSTKNSVTTLTMNDPKKLNGWSGPMMITLRYLFNQHAADDKTKVGGIRNETKSNNYLKNERMEEGLNE